MSELTFENAYIHAKFLISPGNRKLIQNKSLKVYNNHYIKMSQRCDYCLDAVYPCSNCCQKYPMDTSKCFHCKKEFKDRWGYGKTKIGAHLYHNHCLR